MVYEGSQTMPQTVPSAGFTPPCDYSAFAADSFDLSLLPGGESDLPLSPSTLLYTQSPPPKTEKLPQIYTSFYPSSPEDQYLDQGNDLELGPDFQKLLAPQDKKDTYSVQSPGRLEVPVVYPESPASLSSYNSDHQIYQSTFNQFPSSPDFLHPNSPSDQTLDEKVNFFLGHPKEAFRRNRDVYGIVVPQSHEYNRIIKKEQDLYPQNVYQYQIKEENFASSPSQASSPSCSTYSNISSPEPNIYAPKSDNTQLLDSNFLENMFIDKPIKQESTVDFGELLQNIDNLKEILNDDPKDKEPKNQDHQLLRQVLKDTSFQKKYNIRPIDFGLVSGFVGNVIKMEEPDVREVEGELLKCEDEISRETIEPVLSLAIKQMRKDVDNTCSTLGISQEPSKWSAEDVQAWLRYTVQQFGLPSVHTELFDLAGSELVALTEDNFTQRAPQCGSILYAQLEIWKAACADDDLSMSWTACPSTHSSTASSGDLSEDDEEDSSSIQTGPKPTGTRTSGSHIHLWQFLKELLASPQLHGSCIRWLDRGKGVFKIEDSVRVAKLWGKRKNRPAMNYDKLSRSIRQYYKKGIMKKTERSQRLVYQFCHPYSL